MAKILVIDDNQLNRAVAEAQLKDHNTTVVGTYDEAQELLMTRHDFEIVLVDLLMPASGQAQPEGSKFIGQEMPVGIFLALLAAKNGAKKVAVFTDSNHHAHPASACFDAFADYPHVPTVKVEDAQLRLYNDPNMVKSFDKNDLAKPLSWEESQGNTNSVRAKNWLAVLSDMMK